MTMVAQRPRDLVFTLFGDYLLHRTGAVWVGSLIELLEPLGLSPGDVRTVLSRMGRKGWFETRRVGRRSYYDLTPRGRRLLEAGEARIYRPPSGERWDGLWYLVAYSIPEETRHLRDRLRLRLQWLGFGQLGNGLWISPYALRGEVNELAGELGIGDHIEMFRAQYHGYSSSRHLVAKCWDLPSINALYLDFAGRNLPEYERCRNEIATGGLTAEECFVRRFRLVHEYRDFPLIDPYLPPKLLPADWVGGRAAELFERFHDLLAAPAERFVQSVLEIAPPESGSGRAALGA
jgi:phenylacetic acid degradation operon negative regulatory protein